MDLADPKMQRSLTNLDSEIREISIVDSTPDEELCWIKRFRQFLSGKIFVTSTAIFSALFFV